MYRLNGNSNANYFLQDDPNLHCYVCVPASPDHDHSKRQATPETDDDSVAIPIMAPEECCDPFDTSMHEPQSCETTDEVCYKIIVSILGILMKNKFLRNICDVAKNKQKNGNC